MKRKLVLMGFAMMAGLPHAVLAKSGMKESYAQTYASWNGDYMPHYGSEGASFPLMDHLNAAPARGQDAELNKWRLDFGLPRENLIGAQESAMGKGARAGVSLKLDF